MPRADQAATDLVTGYFNAMGAEDLARLGAYYSKIAVFRYAPTYAVVEHKDSTLRFPKLLQP